MRLFGAALALALVLGAGCSSSKESPFQCPSFERADLEGKPYESEDFEAGFCYPADWEQVEGAAGSIVAVLTPQEGDSDAFRENVNLYVEALPSPMTAAEYAEQSVENAGAFIEDFQLVRSGPMELAGGDGHMLEYTGKSGGATLHFDQAIGVHDSIAYVLTYTAAPDEVDAFQAEWEAIVGSFHYTE